MYALGGLVVVVKVFCDAYCFSMHILFVFGVVCVYNYKSRVFMKELPPFEKGSLSFRVGKKSVSIILSRYNSPHQVLKCIALKDIGFPDEEILSMLARYRNGQAKWRKFLDNILPVTLRRRSDEQRMLSYPEIKNILGDVVWSLERHKIEDGSGARGGKDLSVAIWLAWQSIRPIISSKTYWHVSETAAVKSSDKK